MNFPLDLRFVFVLRCLYRQGEKVSKPRKTAKKPEFWQKIKTNINLIDKNVNIEDLNEKIDLNGKIEFKKSGDNLVIRSI